MLIGIPIYPKVDLLDVAAPVEIFSSMKSYVPELGIEIYLIAEDKREVVTRAGVTLRTLDHRRGGRGRPCAIDCLINSSL